MIFKNLFRQKGRTLLTIFGISIGVAAIVGLGALADGLKAGYDSILTGSRADLILSQPDAIDMSTTSVEESISADLAVMPEITAVSGMLQGLIPTENNPYFFVYGYPEDSFILNRFNIVSGGGLNSREAKQAHGSPILLGSSAAEVMHKEVGDSVRLMESVFRVVGIYETGGTLEDNGAVIPLREAQELLGKPRQVSVFYIQLEDLAMRERLETRAARLWPELSLSDAADFADQQLLGNYIQGMVWGVAGLAILIGGIGMMNAQLMSVMERTREIGVLRATGWSKQRVLGMILSESLLVSFLGGLLGVFIGWLVLMAFSSAAGFFGASVTNINSGILFQAFVTVMVLGLIGGAYPAWRASRLQPVEALRYEGGAAGNAARRIPVGGMAAQSLWQRSSRTLLTLGVIGITVGGIMALEALINGVTDVMGAISGDSEIMVRQAGIADTSYSALDEHIGDKIAVLPGVSHVSGLGFTGTILPDSGTIFILFGYAPYEYGIQQFNVVEGESLTNNRQILLGRMMANTLNKSIGDIVEVGGSRFRVVGIYEAGATFEEMGGVISLRDAQSFMGRPRKVTIYMVKIENPSQAQGIVDRINTELPDASASLSGEFVEQMPDLQAMDGMMAGISFLAIAVGGIGVLNTMLMSVLERTREIGVLRALGWRRRRVLGMIINESLLLGFMGGAAGIIIAFGLTYLFSLIPQFGSILTPQWDAVIFGRAFTVALLLGLLGGLYPAYRATRLQPIEALRYE